MENKKIKNKVREFSLLQPVSKEVLYSENEINDRGYKLKKAVTFGTRFNIETFLIISTKNGDVKIKSIIYLANDRYVQLKGKILIPVTAIREVDYVL